MATHRPEMKMAVTSHGWLGEKVAKFTHFMPLLSFAWSPMAVIESLQLGRQFVFFIIERPYIPFGIALLFIFGEDIER